MWFEYVIKGMTGKIEYSVQDFESLNKSTRSENRSVRSNNVSNESSSSESCDEH